MFPLLSTSSLYLQSRTEEQKEEIYKYNNFTSNFLSGLWWKLQNPIYFLFMHNIQRIQEWANKQTADEFERKSVSVARSFKSQMQTKSVLLCTETRLKIFVPKHYISQHFCHIKYEFVGAVHWFKYNWNTILWPIKFLNWKLKSGFVVQV